MTTGSGSGGYSTWEEIPQPPIKRYCHNCARTWHYHSQEQWGVVSPTNTAHIGADYGDTACGIDATGDNWWWRL